jgi:hypothetical protein
MPRQKKRKKETIKEARKKIPNKKKVTSTQVCTLRISRAAPRLTGAGVRDVLFLYGSFNPGSNMEAGKYGGWVKIWRLAPGQPCEVTCSWVQIKIQLLIKLITNFLKSKRGEDTKGT